MMCRGFLAPVRRCPFVLLGVLLVSMLAASPAAAFAATPYKVIGKDPRPTVLRSRLEGGAADEKRSLPEKLGQGGSISFPVIISSLEAGIFISIGP